MKKEKKLNHGCNKQTINILNNIKQLPVTIDERDCGTSVSAVHVDNMRKNLKIAYVS